MFRSTRSWLIILTCLALVQSAAARPAGAPSAPGAKDLDLDLPIPVPSLPLGACAVNLMLNWTVDESPDVDSFWWEVAVDLEFTEIIDSNEITAVGTTIPFYFEGCHFIRMRSIHKLDATTFNYSLPSGAVPFFIDRDMPRFVRPEDSVPDGIVRGSEIELCVEIRDRSLSDCPGGRSGGDVLVEASEYADFEEAASVFVHDTSPTCMPFVLSSGVGRKTLYLRATDCAGNSQVVVVPVTREDRELVCHPNPFNPAAGESSHLVFELSQSGVVSFEVYDRFQRLVRTWKTDGLDAGLVDGETTAGASWDGRNGVGELVADGPYLCRVIDPDKHDMTTKILVLK